MSAELADDAVAWAVDQVERLQRAHLPGWRIPGVFAGHRVAPDVAADLVFTLGLLREGGVTTVVGDDVDEVILRTLAAIDGPGTHTFFSYRVAETVARLGGLDAIPPADRRNVAEACDSSSWIELLDQGLPRNYAAVLARCELGREALGLEPDPTALTNLLERTGTLLGTNPLGFLDDSQAGIARYDIYSADIRLFTEPFAERLGPVWAAGVDPVLDLVAATVTTNGAAFPWGRSSGVLATCMTYELAGLALTHGRNDGSRWLSLAGLALAELDGWFTAGLVNAHQHRSPYDYRGPHRRLQLTLDCLGKVADAARALRGHGRPEEPPGFPPGDTLVALSPDSTAAVWAFRSRDNAFVLPVVGCTVTDYLPAPHNPGLFEVPVGTNLPTGVPSVFHGGRHHTSGGLPRSVSKDPAGLALTYDGFPRSGRFEPEEHDRDLPGTRTVTYRVDGRWLHVDETLTFDDDEVPEAVALQVAETAGRPLEVDFACPTGHATTTVDTAGMKEWRSFWAELPRVHQLDLDPARELRFTWSVRPTIRVLTMAGTHHYHRTVYDPLAGSVTESPIDHGRPDDPDLLDRVDLFHLHWPEWFLGPSLRRHRSFVDALRRAGVRIVWTQHNLVPHQRDDRLDDIYRLWAEEADGVIHHSRWGEAQVRARHRFGDDAVHRVIPHPHFGPLMAPAGDGDRQAVEAELGLRPGAVRLGVIGAPRHEKRLDVVVDGFAACGRDDLELLILSLGPDDAVADRPGVVALPYEMVTRHVYDRRLRALDAVVLPFVPGQMLTTGTVGDVIGAGLPALISDWPFLTEVLGEAGITYGRSADDLARCLRDLRPDDLAGAAEASRALQARSHPHVVSRQTFELFEAVGTTKL